MHAVVLTKTLPFVSRSQRLLQVGLYQRLRPPEFSVSYPPRRRAERQPKAAERRFWGGSTSLEQLPECVVRSPVGGLLSRRQVLQRATALGLGGLVMSALPAADRILALADPAQAATTLPDATLQAVADTLIPGKRVDRTDLGNEIDPKAIAGAHP